MIRSHIIIIQNCIELTKEFLSITISLNNNEYRTSLFLHFKISKSNALFNIIQ